MDRQARIRWMVDEHSDFVARILRSAGVAPSDLDDEVQRTFIVVADRIDRVEPGAERKYLFRVARNVAWHARRTRARRREILDEEPPEPIEALATPEYLANRKRTREVLERVLESMHESVRSVFRLYEFEEMTLHEIAGFLAIPRGTVASRLRRAREQFRHNATAIELACGFGVDGPPPLEEPGLLRRDRVTALERALLGVGASTRASPSMHAGALALFGLAAPPMPP